ncbi:thioesterase II family protein [Flavobacterium pectinovorum]|jgi:surfactin synthase thioesterase subunit|uniref:Surfactin synthase thioesterase subunit n=1 Tax=Flavobacterium pectinovorum TaxID=29533 RepID=A0AB36NU53_9FLAO|nr:thioesterase domain-containing protein [Flavobacterium pectinovorum]OXA98977.1 hypothetical protein B0A72_22975 [Flavobacterium pectinovorum]SHN22399.1 Surfactin synthase thioesterase subunit [Flavobacterium pectinovorum]
MKIISLHFAGGNKYSLNKIFTNFNNYVPFELERNNNIAELNKIIDRFVILLKNQVQEEKSYVIYGHSMGALIAYLLCQRLQELNYPMPKKLIVSGKKSPSTISDKKIVNLNDEDFWNEIIALGGIPDEIKNNPELINYYLPILKYDFKVIESYQYENRQKLSIPIDVFYGSDDAIEGEMTGWRDETTREVNITQLKGNHFFIFNHSDYFRNYFNNLIRNT